MPKNNSSARRAERRKDAERRFANSKHDTVGRKASLIYQELDDTVYTYTYDGMPMRRPHYEFVALRQADLHFKTRLDAFHLASERAADALNTMFNTITKSFNN